MSHINIGIMRKGVCIEVAVFDSIETAQAFFAAGMWVDADTIAEIPDGYGIGDLFDGEDWTKQDPGEPDTMPPPEPYSMPEPSPDPNPVPDGSLSEVLKRLDKLDEKVEKTSAIVDTMLGVKADE